MSKEEGFSLVELLIVVCIIGLIAAIAVPNLVRARESADSASAVSSVRTLITAENLYYNSTSNYATLTELMPTGTLDTDLGSGSKSDYGFVLTVDSSTVPASFICTADPLVDSPNLPHYFTDQTAVIRVAQGVPATSISPPF